MKLTGLTLATAALIFVSPAVFAQGVSSEAPGQQPKGTHDSPGASYNAPGQEMQRGCEKPKPGFSWRIGICSRTFNDWFRRDEE